MQKYINQSSVFVKSNSLILTIMNLLSTVIITFVKIAKMKIVDQFAEYLFIKKKDDKAPKDKWIGYMHGMNRISIFVFLIGLIVLMFKLVILPMLK